MYICNCNGITEREVETAISAGVKRWDDVHAYYDCEPCCGQCECEIKDAIKAAKRERRKPAEPFFAPPALAAAG